jgi:hypothetical protein
VTIDDPLSVAVEYLNIAARLEASGEYRSPDVTPIEQHAMARGLVAAHKRIEELEAGLRDCIALTYVAEHAQDDAWRAERDRLQLVADGGGV